jgi:hypothetical protein
VGALWTNDNLRPAVSTPLVGFDNYEIYDLVITNSTETRKDYNYYPAVESHVLTNSSTRDELLPFGQTPAGIVNDAYLQNPAAPEAVPYGYDYLNGVYAQNWIIYENYQDVVSTIPERLVLDKTTTNKTPPKIYAVQRYTPYGAANSDLIYNLFDEFKQIADSRKISWDKLIINDDVKYTGTAQVSGYFTLEYWSHNYLEGHPLINYTLDYRKIKVKLIKGQTFSFTLYHPVAHTIVAASELQIAVANNKPPIVDILASNRNYANSLTVTIGNPQPPPSGQLFKKYRKNRFDPLATYNPATGIGYRFFGSFEWTPDNNPQPITGYGTTTYTWIDYRVLRATNRVTASSWGVDADIGDYPAISPADLDRWHFAPQPDGSNGSIIMDSIRTIQTLELAQKIADAIDAATYSVDPATGAPRAANLGHIIEKIANFIGYRPEPDGSIDMQKETTIYAAAVVKDDAITGLDYHAGRFGKKGMLVRRLPNKLGANGKYEPGGKVKVHDLLQLQTELFGQLNQALNIQDSTSITIRDGSATRNYPNQLALLCEIGTGVLQHRRQIREIWASSIVTQKTVNEVLAGFGLPVVNKSITLNGQQLPYWGVQPSQSLQKEIATAAYQGGAQLGQLL